MRRRSGAPTNHLESAGKSMARKHNTSNEVADMAKSMGSARIAMGMDAYQLGNVTMPNVGTPVPRKNVQSMDPTAGGKANHANVPYNEKMGASYRVSVPFTPTIDPAAGPTMASARVVPSIQGRENPNFESGIQGAQSY